MIQSRAEPPQQRVVPPAYAARRARRGEPIPRHWPVQSRDELVSAGWRPRSITRAVRAGLLHRARENVYLDPHADPLCTAACRFGGVLTCVSELERWGVFVMDSAKLHIAVPRSSSRHRVIDRETRTHWSRDRGVAPGGWASEPLVDALERAIRCQGARAAIATLDSALHLRLVSLREVDLLFERLPRRHGVLRQLIDPRAESGAESLMRLILRALGCRFECQVDIAGVGRVDFLVEGWLIVECDSEAHHGRWDDIRRDRRRDQAAAARGFHTYRAIAEDIFWHSELVVAALRGLLAR